MAHRLLLSIYIYFHLLASVRQPKKVDMGLSGANPLLSGFNRANPMAGHKLHSQVDRQTLLFAPDLRQ
jgi:hypothetical protein